MVIKTKLLADVYFRSKEMHLLLSTEKADSIEKSDSKFYLGSGMIIPYNEVFRLLLNLLSKECREERVTKNDLLIVIVDERRWMKTILKYGIEKVTYYPIEEIEFADER